MTPAGHIFHRRAEAETGKISGRIIHHRNLFKQNHKDARRRQAPGSYSRSSPSRWHHTVICGSRMPAALPIDTVPLHAAFSSVSDDAALKGYTNPSKDYERL